MDEKRATELVPVIDSRAKLPPILVGRLTPAVEAQVGSFYGSVAEIFERWVTRRQLWMRDRVGETHVVVLWLHFSPAVHTARAASCSSGRR